VATKRERQRQLARDAYARRQVRQAQRVRRTRELWASGIAIVLVLGAATGVAVVSGVFTPPKPFSCTYTASGKAARKVSRPPKQTDIRATYTAKITTNRGTIDINLLNSKAACTVNSFVSLADQGFYNNTPCPRLDTTGIYMLQCGDPTGTGSGGPGYKFESENLSGAKYTAGTVAMANSGTPDSNGSQFFLVYRNTKELSASYTPFGTITSGLSVLKAIAAKGDNNSNPAGGGNPKEKVQIESVAIARGSGISWALLAVALAILVVGGLVIAETLRRNRQRIRQT
jgi:cyclophilin family peptidyl-prolyl cis-trans isomerase